MICSCGAETAHIRVNPQGIESCPICDNFSETSGQTDGLLARVRVRADSVKYEGDMITPWKFDKNQKKVVPNKDFVKRFPNQTSINKEEIKSL